MQGTEVSATCGEETPNLIVSTRSATLPKLRATESKILFAELSEPYKFGQSRLGVKEISCLELTAGSASRHEAQPNNSLGGEI